MSKVPSVASAIVKKAFTEFSSDDSKTVVIEKMAASFVSAGVIKESDLQTIIDGALAREELGSTGIGNGIAIPHCKTDLVDKIVCAYGYCPEGLDFDSIDGADTHGIFLLLSSPDMREEHLAFMKKFAMLIRKEDFSDFLKQCENAASLASLFKEFEDA